MKKMTCSGSCDWPKYSHLPKVIRLLFVLKSYHVLQLCHKITCSCTQDDKVDLSLYTDKAMPNKKQQQQTDKQNIRSNHNTKARNL